MFNFWSKPDPKDEQRQVDRQLRKVGRDIERDRRQIEREEKKLEWEIKKLAKEGNVEGCRLLAKQLVQLQKQNQYICAAESKVQGFASQNSERGRRRLGREEKKLEWEIKKLAKEGNNEGCRLLAKQLVQLRKQKQRTYTAGSKVQGVAFQNKAMGANVKLAEAMGAAGKTMSDMNKLMKPEELAATVNAFSRENMKMEMTDEMINDTLDDMLTESGDEEESDNIITQVLDEIGIEMSGKMADAPNPVSGKIGESSKSKGLTDDEIEAQLAKLRG